jgi:hypothetical protein
MPESVFTQTMPLLFAGGVCCCGAAFGVEAGLLDAAEELPEELGELAGALEGAGAGAGAGAGLELEVAEAEPDELEVEPEAGCDASADVSDFFVRFFFVVVAPESLELLAAAELAAG